MKQTIFFGTYFTTDGHKQGNGKVPVIDKIPQPTKVKDLHHFWCMNYLIRYSPRLTELGDSNRELTKTVLFIWGPEHTKAFDAIRKEITSASILRYDDPSKPLTL